MMAIVTDLDDTLVASSGEPVEAMLRLLLDAVAAGERVIVVSGRPVERLAETEQWLEDNGLDIGEHDVHLSDFPSGPNASREFKVYKAKLLLDEGIDISAWYENDALTRRALSDLGVNVVNPATVRSVDAVGVSLVVDMQAPVWMRENALKGLRFFADGLGGDGLTDATVREARDMSRGNVADDKWVRIAAWVARHRVDWESVPRNNDPQVDGFPGAGAVAAYLWGVDPTDSESADKVIEFARNAVDSEGDTVDENRDNDAAVAEVAAEVASDAPAPAPVRKAWIDAYSRLMEIGGSL